MKKKILIIQGSSLKKINIKTDTSFFLGLEAQRRRYQIYYYEPKDLSFINGKVAAFCSKVKFLDDSKQPVKILSKKVLNLLVHNNKYHNSSFAPLNLKKMKYPFEYLFFLNQNPE